MDLGLAGRVAVVTGASRGIGRAIAHAFADEGAAVAICARGEDALRRTASELRQKGADVHAEVCDVSDGAALTGFLETAATALGGVDALVNNASALVAADDDTDWQSAFAVDVMATVRASRTVAEVMAARGGGAIVHIASVSGLVADDPVAYGAMKAAAIHHSRALAERLAPRGVRVNVVAPGSVEFPGGVWDERRGSDPALYAEIRDGIPLGRLGRPEDVADAVVFLASRRAAWITGAVLRIDGGQVKSDR